MKFKRKISFVSTIGILGTLVFAMPSLASWRSQLMLKAPGYSLKAVSPDGKWIILTPDNMLQPYRAWSSKGVTRNLPMTVDQPLFGDNTHILWPVFRRESGLFKVINLETGKTERILRQKNHTKDDNIEDFNVSADGKEIRVLTKKSLRVWNWKSGILLHNIVLKHHFSDFSRVFIAPDAQTIAVAFDGTVSLWNVRTGQRQINFGEDIRSAWFIDNTPVLGSIEDGGVTYFHLSDGKKLWTWPDVILTPTMETPDGKFAVARTEAGLKFRDLQTGKLAQLRPEITQYESKFLFSKDGNWLWTSNSKGEFRRWQTR